ncbi:junctional adhesion molecule 3B-like [Carassius gibelio]|uniref:junctional adhesion molecule 3B-like n=1 Tax=Carassius gibelio TaxID=101364 RepID=UPI002279BC87|nr:junctional adhesion molecule 3B-like [Carassius gibelio]
MEGDSVTLIYVETNKQEDIKWYFNDTQIAEVTGNHSKIYTDNQDKERFGNRLQVNQTGSLTITNITNTDSGEYKLQINSSSENIFNVTVNDVPAAELHGIKRKSVKEGESVTLDPEIVKNPNDTMKWYFNEILIAEITRDQSEICSDVQCKQRFRNRLKLDHQTGSLTITNTRTTDSGDYKLLIISSRFSIVRNFGITATIDVSGLSAGAIAGIVIACVVLNTVCGGFSLVLFH